jgi:hypothetical protein
VHSVVVNVHGSGLATTILAGFGVMLGILSLGWQAISFALSGSRINVSIRNGMSNGSGVMTVASDLTEAAVSELQQQGFTQPVIGVQVRNLGRSPTSVTWVGVLYDNGAMYSLVNGSNAMNSDLPARLEGESGGTWYFAGRDIHAYGQAMNEVFTTPARSIRGRVVAGGRSKPALSKNRLAL